MMFAADFRRIARQALQGKWVLAVITGLVAGLLGAGIYSGAARGHSSNSGRNFLFPFYHSRIGGMIAVFLVSIATLILMWGIFTFIIGGTIKLGYCRFNKNLIRENIPQFSDLFADFDLFGKALLLRIVVMILVFLWTLLFIIPGIIAYYRYSMAFYIMDDDPSVTVMEAIEYSKQMMMGNKGRLFCLQISFIGWAILCIFTAGIGLLWLIPYMNAAEAAFYLEVSGQRQTPSGFQNAM